MTSTMMSALLPDRPFDRSLVFSSQQQDSNGILVHHHQNAPYLIETELPALSTHWIQLMLREQLTRLIQKQDDSHSQRLRQRVHDSVVQTGDSIFVPAGQPSYWHCSEQHNCESILHIKYYRSAVDRTKLELGMRTSECKVGLFDRFASLPSNI